MWSRVGAGSTTVVSPSAYNPAEEDRRFHLGARNRQLVRDPPQRSRIDPERQMPVLRLDAGAHASERLRHPPHRSRAERLVADELELPAALAGEDAGQQAHERAGVAAVDRGAGRDEPTQPLAVHVQRLVVVLDHRDAERAHCIDRRLGVGRAAEPGDPGLALGDRTDQHGAMGDRLVARDGEMPGDPVHRLDSRHSPITGAITTP